MIDCDQYVMCNRNIGALFASMSTDPLKLCVEIGVFNFDR